MSLILASGSPRRRELLQQLNLDFQVITRDVDESFSKDHLPEQVVQDLASRKAASIADQYEQAVIIGSDTLVILDGEILGKPRDPQDALDMLTRLSGREHQVNTGIAIYDVVNHRTERIITDVSSTKVTMRLLTKEQIKAYIQTGEPLDKAGAYGIQGKGACLIEKINGCYFNVVGLSLVLLDQMMGRLGYSLQQDFQKV